MRRECVKEKPKRIDSRRCDPIPRSVARHRFVATRRSTPDQRATTSRRPRITRCRRDRRRRTARNRQPSCDRSNRRAETIWRRYRIRRRFHRPVAADRAPTARGVVAALFIPRLRLAGVPRPAQYSGKPDGPALRPRLLHRGSVCGRDVPLAPHAARASIAWYPTRRAGLAGTWSVAAYRSAGEAALSGGMRFAFPPYSVPVRRRAE